MTRKPPYYPAHPLPTAPTPRKTWLARVLGLPRIGRILLAGGFALMATLAVMPLFDRIYDAYFFSLETRGASAWAAALVGVAVYALGWWLVVGAGDAPPPRRAAAWYVIAGLVVTVLVVALIVYGAVSGYMAIAS